MVAVPKLSLVLIFIAVNKEPSLTLGMSNLVRRKVVLRTKYSL